MRRKDREITSIDKKIEIIEKNKVCRIALSKDDFPYIVPLNYGYRFEKNKLTLYFHSAAEGKKIDIIKENNNTCFEIDCDCKLIENEKPCSYGYEFKSVIGFGKMIITETAEEKINGLNILMKHQTGKETLCNFPEEALEKLIVYKMEVEEFTGKQR
ncbi:MAG: pyridoxamine 5'-phosphate oxidase family protein [Spirochaetaceae bacterium]|nr:pyridoxamine 5'-phosphate oxidase family protein [Spirochaetaceae bacterium]